MYYVRNVTHWVPEGSCEHRNEPPGSIKGGEFRD